MSVWKTYLKRLKRPLVIAHRGASRVAPENSLAALRLCADLGADGVEFDVQACATRELVVFHDHELERCTGVKGTVKKTPLTELQGLTLDKLEYGPRGERIPTLAQWLDAVPPGLLVNLEVKADTIKEANEAARCAKALHKAGLGARSVVSSFAPWALARAALTCPEIERGTLVSGRSWRSALAAGLIPQPGAIHVSAKLVTASRVRSWKALGLRVAVWTVDEADEAERCLSAGADALITNHPDRIRPVAERFGR